MLEDLADLFETAAASDTPIAAVVGTIRSGSPRTSCAPTPAASGSTPNAIAWWPPSNGPGRSRNKSAISTLGVEKSFGDLHVLKGVDVSAEPGSVLALLGSNGAGKTTLVRILATLLKPDAGRATILDLDVVDQAAKVRGVIGLTGQFAAVDEILTGRENLVLIGQLRHVDDPAGVAADLLERFDLVAAADRRTGDYSGGMRRRLDIAMSLIGDPAVVFLDEPTTGLDPQARLEVWATIKQLAGSGTTVLLTTQNLDEAEQLADRIAILHEGRIIIDGTLAQLQRILPQAEPVYVEQQPSLEQIFLAITGDHPAPTPEPTQRRTP